MLASRDTSVAGVAISINTPDSAAVVQEQRMKNFKRRAALCVRVAPWVSAISCIMVGVGLGVWYVYTKRSLAHTQNITLQLFKEPLELVQQLGNVLDWTTLLMCIVVSCLLGVTTFVSLMRTYQFSARLPETSCGAPGRLSYGSYAGFIAILNFVWWLLTIVVALLMAGSLVWLTTAFLFNNALTTGVQSSPDATNTNSYIGASADASLSVCPVNCFNMGSFHDALKLSTSCWCSKSDLQSLRQVATWAWQDLVHVLASLALMGLGCLWQLMNMSANFAHARRDLREAPSRKAPAQFLTGDAIAAVTTTSPYTPSKKQTPVATKRDQDGGLAADSSAFPAATEFVGVASMSETTHEPAPAQHITYNSAYETYLETPVAETTPVRRASSPSPRNTEAEQPSPSSGGRNATFNTTAQRYAAYRLRAAQAAAAKPSGEGRKQWVR